MAVVVVVVVFLVFVIEKLGGILTQNSFIATQRPLLTPLLVEY